MVHSHQKTPRLENIGNTRTGIMQNDRVTLGTEPPSPPDAERFPVLLATVSYRTRRCKIPHMPI